MKNIIKTLIFSSLFSLSTVAVCDMGNTVYAKTDSVTLEIILEDNTSAQALYDKLQEGDLTVSMDNYGNFERVGSLGCTLIRNDTTVRTEPGDVILYNGNTITIYYGYNTWEFTKLGHINMSEAELRRVLKVDTVPTINVTFSTRN